VAVGTASDWLLHCGDALPFGGLDSPAPDSISRAGCGLHIDRIRRVEEEHAGEIEIPCSHVPLQVR
jgi:hypothetical protein